MTNYERAKELVDKILDLNHPDVFINDIEQALATAEREALERAARVAELEGVNSPNEAYEVACENVASLIRDVSIQVTQGVEGSGQGCKSQGADGKGAAETGLVPGLPTSASSKDLARDSAYRSSAARTYDNHAGVTTQTAYQKAESEHINVGGISPESFQAGWNSSLASKDPMDSNVLELKARNARLASRNVELIEENDRLKTEVAPADHELEMRKFKSSERIRLDHNKLNQKSELFYSALKDIIEQASEFERSVPAGYQVQALATAVARRANQAFIEAFEIEKKVSRPAEQLVEMNDEASWMDHAEEPKND